MNMFLEHLIFIVAPLLIAAPVLALLFLCGEKTVADGVERFAREDAEKSPAA